MMGLMMPAAGWRAVTATIIEHWLRLRVTINASDRPAGGPTARFLAMFSPCSGRAPQPDTAHNFHGASDVVKEAIVATVTNADVISR